MRNPSTAGVALALAVVAGVSPTSADQSTALAGGRDADKACSAFAWPVKRERAWFDNPDLQRRESSSRLKRIDRAVDLILKPANKVDYFLPPPVALQKGAYSGSVVFFGVPHVGMYQVTLSEIADIDVFENGMRLKALATSQAPECPDARMSVRFDLAAGDLVLVEVINAHKPSIKVAFDEAS
jgi:hypothetical protein